MEDELPVDHRLGRVYRIGGGLTGLGLVVFAVLGFARQLPFLDTQGERILMLSSNGLLALISAVVGTVLVVGAIIGGNVAARLNTVFGGLFLLSGLASLVVLRTSLNMLAFEMSNVIFSFVVGLLLLTFGLYGRVSGALPPDNPGWRERHGLPPEPQEGEDLNRTALVGGAVDSLRGTDGEGQLDNVAAADGDDEQPATHAGPHAERDDSTSR